MTADLELTDEALTTFGIGFDDDGFHPYDPAERWWNESWFWDWYDADGSVAGHCRIGCIPNQNRVWLWLYLFRDGEWLAVEQPYLDFGLLRRPEIALDQAGISFSYKILSPLRAGRLRVESAARVVSGARAGRVLPVEVDLEVHSIGVPHSTGQGNEPGHMSESYDARRMEQPITLAGTIAIDGDKRGFEGRGERDHSWGPRYWLLEWSFLVLNGEHKRLQCVEVRFPGDGVIEVGYLQSDGASTELDAVKLAVERREGLVDAAHGTCEVTATDGTTFAFSYEEVSSHEMDLSHVLEPAPPKSVYRRTLIRATPTDGSAPLYGWLEDHILPGFTGA
ncbi:MAG: hypothetical protein HYX32_07915 [Actinobacteria bacterium]|nr:hypothetical protein [Actinomycetota bacterium]